MTTTFLSRARWEELQEWRNEFTCYSAALATWLAATGEDWVGALNPRLWLRIVEDGDGRFGFAYFPPDLRTRLGLIRTGADGPQEAVDGVLSELARSGRVIVAGDGFHLPWHVAAGRRHVPHWFVVGQEDGELGIADPFACRNELGMQECARRNLAPEGLAALLPALPGDDPVHRLREIYALGDEMDASTARHQWFVHAGPAESREPNGVDGPAAVLRLARHFRERGQDPGAYAQADDVWSIARHRAFMLHEAQSRGGDHAALAEWVAEHGAPLAKRWSHIAPLIMQAVLALRAGRPASASVPETLEQLAELERSAALAFDRHSFSI